MDFAFNLLDADTLKEMANVGAGNAATSLANLVNKRIDMTVPEVKMLDFKDLPDVLNGAENLMASILVKINGNISGTILYLMDEVSTCYLINTLMKCDKKSFSEFEELDYFAITKVGNSLINSYLNALSNLTNFKINKSTPFLSVDMVGTILSIPATEVSKVGDEVLLIKSTFNENCDFFSYFVLILDLKDLKTNFN